MSVTRFFRRSRWDDERRRELEAHIAHRDRRQHRARLQSGTRRGRWRMRKLGNAALVREEIYQMNTIGWLESVWQDLRYGARVLRRSPGFAAVALLSLALGIGANAAIFQLLDVVRLRTLPLHHPEQIVEVRDRAEQERPHRLVPGRASHAHESDLGEHPRRRPVAHRHVRVGHGVVRHVVGRRIPAGRRTLRQRRVLPARSKAAPRADDSSSRRTTFADAARRAR